MNIFYQIYEFFWYTVATVITLLVVLILLRAILNYADVNPFSRPMRIVRDLTDPLVNPVRRGIVRLGLDARLAPFITILIAILLGYIAVQLVWTLMFTLSGIIESLERGSLFRLIGFIIYGILAGFSLLIFMRIMFSWGVSSINRMSRFLIRTTEPVLGPARRIIPPLGMFDISAMVVLFLIQLLEQAIMGTLLAR
jgi:YggT family protein